MDYSTRSARFGRHQRRLEEGERLILHSDGITARRTADGLFGLDGIERAVAEAGSRSATALARAIQEAVMAAAEDPLQDDAVAVVLAPTSDPDTIRVPAAETVLFFGHFVVAGYLLDPAGRHPYQRDDEGDGHHPGHRVEHDSHGERVVALHGLEELPTAAPAVFGKAR